MTSYALPPRLEDVAEGPGDAESFARHGEIGSTDDGRANANAEPDTAAVVHVARIDVAFEWHHFAGIQKCGHLEDARRLPPMLDTDVDRVVVAKAVSPETTEVIVAAQNGLEINRDLIPLFGECQYDGRPDRDDATLVEIGNVLLELVLGLAKGKCPAIDVPVFAIAHPEHAAAPWSRFRVSIV